MLSYYTFLALDIANERTRQADRDRLAKLARSGDRATDRSFRRGLAIAIASLSRGSAAVVRWLDDEVADDLAESVGPNELAPTN
jgi:hypothetical protein